MTDPGSYSGAGGSKFKHGDPLLRTGQGQIILLQQLRKTESNTNNDAYIGWWHATVISHGLGLDSM